MTPMTADEKKQELMRYRLLIQRIERKKQERQRWLDIGTKTTPVYSDMPKSTNEADKVAQAGMARAQIAVELAQEICELASEKRRIEQSIQGIEDDKQRLILEKHYIDGKTFEQIAEDMNFSERQIRRLHLKAICKMSFNVRQKL